MESSHHIILPEEVVERILPYCGYRAELVNDFALGLILTGLEKIDEVVNPQRWRENEKE